MKKIVQCLLASLLLFDTHSLLALDSTDSQPAATSTVVNPAMDVYISRRGLTFHKQDCSVIQGYEVKKVTLEEAVEKGMKPCPVCLKDNAALNTEIQKESEQKNKGEKLNYLK